MASMRDGVSVDGATMKLYLSIPDGAGRFPPSWSSSIREAWTSSSRR